MEIEKWIDYLFEIFDKDKIFNFNICTESTKIYFKKKFYEIKKLIDGKINACEEALYFGVICLLIYKVLIDQDTSDYSNMLLLDWVYFIKILTGHFYSYKKVTQCEYYVLGVLEWRIISILEE